MLSCWLAPVFFLFISLIECPYVYCSVCFLILQLLRFYGLIVLVSPRFSWGLHRGTTTLEFCRFSWRLRRFFAWQDFTIPHYLYIFPNVSRIGGDGNNSFTISFFSIISSHMKLVFRHHSKIAIKGMPQILQKNVIQFLSLPTTYIWEFCEWGNLARWTRMC